MILNVGEIIHMFHRGTFPDGTSLLLEVDGDGGMKVTVYRDGRLCGYVQEDAVPAEKPFIVPEDQLWGAWDHNGHCLHVTGHFIDQVELLTR